MAVCTDADGVTSMIHGFLLGISAQVGGGTSAGHLHAAADAVLANRDARGH